MSIPPLPTSIAGAAASAFAKVFDAATHALKYSLGRPLNLAGIRGVPDKLRGFQVANLGAPGGDNAYNGVNANEIETKVLDLVGKLWRVEGQNVVGYVTSGGSESNNLATRLATQKCPDAAVLHNKRGHYSGERAVDVVGVPLGFRFPIDAKPSGAISLGALEQTLKELKTKGIQSVIVILTCGTTFTEGHDNIGAVLRLLEQYGYDAANRYVHVDAALSGFTLPLVSGVDEDIRPGFHHPIDSMCVSGHKFPGSDPCSVFLGRKEFLEQISLEIEYIGSKRKGGKDFTLSCTRNAQPIMQLYYILLHYEHTDYFQKAVAESLRLAEMIADEFTKWGVPVVHNPFAITVSFPQPPDELCEKYYLVSQEGKSHIIAMPHVTETVLYEFALEYLFWFKTTRPIEAAVKMQKGVQ